jgi:hypothetical protein
METTIIKPNSPNLKEAYWYIAPFQAINLEKGTI